jgi:hypothetical protein
VGWLERVAVTLAKNPYVRFGLNDYSVPHTHVVRLLTVLADPYEVRVVDAGAGWARHRAVTIAVIWRVEPSYLREASIVRAACAE